MSQKKEHENNQEQHTELINQRPITSPKNFRTRKLVNSGSSKNLSRPMTGQQMPHNSHLNNTNYNKSFLTSKAGGNMNPKLFSTTGNNKSKQKTIPNHIKHDKEQLYENTMNLKLEINELRDENLKLKTKNVNLEREATKYERMLEEMNKPNTKNSQAVQENSMTVRLKKQLKDVQKDLDSKKKEIEQLKKDHRFTMNQELQEELNLYQQQTKILQVRLQQAMKKNTEFETDEYANLEIVEKQNKIIQTLKSDNVELAVLIKEREDEFNKKNVEFTELERNYNNVSKEKAFLKKQLSENERQMSKTKNESLLTPYAKQNKSNNSQNEQISTLKQDLESKSEENYRLKEKVKQMNQKSKDYEDQLKVQKNDLQTQVEIRDARIQRMEREWVKKSTLEGGGETPAQQQQDTQLQQQYEDLKIKYDQLQEQQQIQQQQQQQQQQNNNKNLDIEQNHRQSVKKPTHIGSAHRKTQIIKRQMPKVNHFDVANIGKNMQFGLINKFISIDDAVKLLFSEDALRKQKQSIRETLNILQTEPFDIINFEDALLVSRYLVEDNTEDYIVVDENRTQDITIIRDVFKKLVNKYSLFQKDEQLKLHDKIADELTKYSASLVDNVKLYIAKKHDLKPGTCNWEDFEKAREYCEMTLRQRELDYLVYLCFELSQDADIIYYEKIVKQNHYEKYKLRVEEFSKEIDEKNEKAERYTQNLHQQGLMVRFQKFQEQNEKRRQEEEEQQRLQEEKEMQAKIEQQQKEEQELQQKQLKEQQEKEQENNKNNNNNDDDNEPQYENENDYEKEQ